MKPSKYLGVIKVITGGCYTWGGGVTPGGGCYTKGEIIRYQGDGLVISGESG